MYKKIMVPLDGSPLAECVLPHVNSIARGCGVSEIVFVRVAEPVFVATGAYTDGSSIITGPEMEKVRYQELKRARENAQQYLERIMSGLSFPGIYTRHDVLDGRVAEALVDYGDKNGFDLMVIATHGRSGVSRWVMGSVADRVLRATCVPVLMVRAPGCVPGI